MASSTAAFRKVLVPTDFSETADQAFEWALRIAGATGHVHAVHAIETFAVPMHIPLETQQLVTTKVQEHLDKLAWMAREAGVACTSEHAIGAPLDVIEKARESFDPDLLVLGTHGHAAYLKFVLGSTADRIIRTSGTPVLAVHPADEREPGSIGTVLVGTDFCEEASLAIRAAIRLLESVGREGRLVLLHVCHAPMVYETEAVASVIANQLAAEEEQARQRLEAMATPLRADGLKVEVVARQGYPAQVIVEEARVTGADLIALGTHGRSGLSHLLLGSVAERVVHHADRPVLTVPRAAARQPSAASGEVSAASGRADD